MCMCECECVCVCVCIYVCVCGGGLKAFREKMISGICCCCCCRRRAPSSFQHFLWTKGAPHQGGLEARTAAAGSCLSTEPVYWLGVPRLVIRLCLSEGVRFPLQFAATLGRLLASLEHVRDIGADLGVLWVVRRISLFICVTELVFAHMGSM